MSFDGLALAAMAGELRERLLGARVQKIVQPEPLGIALETYGEHHRSWLVLSAEPQRPGAYLAAERAGRGVETPSPLLLLLRKHVEGLRIGDVSQPPGERILSFGFVGYPPTNDDPPALPRGEPQVLFRLIIEAISQYSNLILVNADGIILDAMRRISAEQNRSRITLPRHPYVPPPSQRKRPLDSFSTETCLAALNDAGPGAAIWQCLVTGFGGLGPLVAREIVFRALGEARARIPTDLAEPGEMARWLAERGREIIEAVDRLDFRASIARDPTRASTSTSGAVQANTSDARDDIIAFAPYALTHLKVWEPRASLSEAAEETLRQARAIGAIDLGRVAVRRAIDAERSIVERKRDSLRRALDGTSKLEDLRQKGELLLTYSSLIPRGAATFRADSVDLELDPRLSAVDNAQAVFRRYRKVKAALREVPTLLAEVELKLKYLDEMTALAEFADSTEVLRQMRSEVRPARPGDKRPTRRRRAPNPADSVLRLKTTDNLEILVGRSAGQNHAVTFDLGRPDDIWLHARGSPGAHVILRATGTNPSSRALEEAAAIAAYYSAGRASTKVTVDWTRRKLVRRLGAPGLVSYTGETSLVVRPDPEPTKAP